MRRILSVTAALGLCLVGTAALAQGNLNTPQGQAFARWRIQDKCVADATKQFPDRDPISLQKRDGAVDQCLAAANMPPRQHLAPSPPPPDAVAPKPD
jgi:hypothetical protein